MSYTLIGQPHVVSVLTNAIADERIAHAYLFAGPRHVGKTRAAIEFAQALNCTGEEPHPCGKCRSCEAIAAMSHPDVEHITLGGLCIEQDHDHAKDNNRDIRICQIRRLEAVVSRAAYQGRYRVLIIDPADRMNEPTANALLKTLEEPPPNVVIILISDREEMLLPTVRSRARRLGFLGMSAQSIEQALRNRWETDPPLAAKLARLSGGRIGWAVIALHDETMVEQRREALDQAETLAAGGLAERFRVAASLGDGHARKREKVQETLETWQQWWRDILMIRAGAEAQATLRDRLDSLNVRAAQCDVAGAARAVRAIGDARQQLEENAAPTLTLEAMFLAWPQLRATRTNAVEERISARG